MVFARSLFIIVCLAALAGCYGKPARVSQMTVAISPPTGAAATIAATKAVALGTVSGGEQADVSGFHHVSAITEANLRAAVEGSLKGSQLLWSGTDKPPRTLNVTFLKLTRVQTTYSSRVSVITTIGYTVTAADGSVPLQKIVEFTSDAGALDYMYTPSMQQAASEDSVRGNIRQFLEAWLATPTTP